VKNNTKVEWKKIEWLSPLRKPGEGAIFKDDTSREKIDEIYSVTYM